MASDPEHGAGGNEPTGTDEVPVPARHATTRPARRTVIAVLAMLAYQGFAISINGLAAPWIGQSFGLDETGLATLYAWVSMSAIGGLVLARLADRVGRRRVLLWCLIATPLFAFGAALATSLVWFALCDLLLYASISATVSGSVVMLAESLPIEQRAKGQSYGGLAMGFGSGWCVIGMPLLVDAGHSWRWMLVVVAAGLAGVPFIARLMSESEHWEHAAASGATRRTPLAALLHPAYRRRTIPVSVCVLLGAIGGMAANNWSYYHAVSEVGLTPGVTSTMVLVAGAVGAIGFPFGAWSAERLGRVPTVVVSGLLASGGAAWFYWGPPAHTGHAVVWLGAAYGVFSVAANAIMVSGNAAVTELFPTAVRGTMVGWLSLLIAVGAVAGQALMAVLASPLGGLSNVVGYLALLGVPGALLFGWLIDETRGLALEVAAHEDR